MPVVLMGAGEQQENLSRTRERRAPYFSPLSPGLTLIGTQGTCHMHPCAPTTCHSARQCVFFELKLRQSGMERLAGKPHFEPENWGSSVALSGPGDPNSFCLPASLLLLHPSQAKRGPGHLLSLTPLPTWSPVQTPGRIASLVAMEYSTACLPDSWHQRPPISISITSVGRAFTV